MLSKPSCGWVDVTIGDWTDRASYLTHPAKDILNAIAETLRTHQPSVCYFDAEGWEYYIIINANSVIVVKFNEDGNGEYPKEIFVSLEDLAKEIISDIKENLEQWGLWDLVDPLDFATAEENEIMLSALCTKVWCQLPENNKDKETETNNAFVISEVYEKKNEFLFA